jgi:hypothetical protein
MELTFLCRIPSTISGIELMSAPQKKSRLKRRTLRQVRAATESAHHHNVYVVLLDPAVTRHRKIKLLNPNRRPELPCVYVGLTGLTPEERFANHKAGLKSAWVVKRYGLRLLPELFAHLNPMPFEAAAQMEADLAEDLRRAGYTVTGGY